MASQASLNIKWLEINSKSRRLVRCKMQRYSNLWVVLSPSLTAQSPLYPFHQILVISIPLFQCVVGVCDDAVFINQIAGWVAKGVLENLVRQLFAVREDGVWEGRFFQEFRHLLLPVAADADDFEFFTAPFFAQGSQVGKFFDAGFALNEPEIQQVPFSFEVVMGESLAVHPGSRKLRQGSPYQAVAVEEGAAFRLHRLAFFQCLPIGYALLSGRLSAR